MEIEKAIFTRLMRGTNYYRKGEIISVEVSEQNILTGENDESYDVVYVTFIKIAQWAGI